MMLRPRLRRHWLLAFGLGFCHPVSAKEHKLPPPVPCDGWLDRTLKTMESAPMLRQRDLAIVAVGKACAGVPAALRQAGADYGKAPTQKAKARLLAGAAAGVLKDSCSASEPLGTAASLVTSCPLPGPGEKADPAVLARMRAADYVFLNALMTSLIAAGAYNHTAYRIVLNYILSSAQLGEQQQAKRKP
jgi:hypothetical protein